ncbi:MAG: hypothetical protein K8R21_04900 [Leptospira sp.]|nr:hypothetical protein [Leptospira sp.]
MLRKLFHDLVAAPVLLKNFIGESVEITRIQLPVILRANFYFSIVLIIVHFGMMFLVFKIAYERSYQNLLLGFFTLPVTSYMLNGLLRFYLAMVREQQTSYSMIFQGYKNYLAIFLFALCYYVLYNVLFKLAFEFGEQTFLFQVRIGMGVILFFWLLARMAFTPIFIIEENLNIKEAIKRSFMFTSGKSTITIFFTFTGIFLLGAGVLIIFIGVLYSMAIAICMYVLLYDVYAENKFSRKKRIAKNLDFIPEQKRGRK